MFTIVITDTKKVRRIAGREWKVIGQEPCEHAPDQLRDIWGYTPEIEKEVEETNEILRQTRENINVVAVIKAINEIE